MTDSVPGGLHAGFLRSAVRFADRPALEVRGETYAYSTLFDRASSLAATLAKLSVDGEPPLTAVFAYRSWTAFAGVLAVLLRGHGYVPLNPTFPPARTRLMLERSRCRAVIVDGESSALLDDVVAGAREPYLIVLPDHDDVGRIARSLPMHTVLGARDLERPEAYEPAPTDPDAVAYLLFTSGSTGLPKGVMVTHGNAVHLVETLAARYGITEEDRFSQTFDMTFDLSVFDMFVAWGRGACVCCPSAKSLIAPGKFINDAGLTVWFSVPSTAVLMKRLGMLKPERYPRLRWSLFCGEPLTVETARAWTAAASCSTLENLYGPTEVTVACTAYRWNPERSPAESELGLVPIGTPFPGMEALVVDRDLKEVAPGEEGELLMAGPQVTPGYWEDPERTQAAFLVPPGRNTVHYRTGDRVRRADGEGPLRYIGRMDDQIKVHGYRVELGEVEAVLREASGVDAIVAVGWPRTEEGAGGVVAFVGDTTVDVRELQVRAGRRLPDYMVPRQIHLIANLPLNQNGKFDRKALLRSLEDEQ